MMLDFEIKDDELQFVLARMPDRIRAAMVFALRKEMTSLTALVKAAYLSGDPLHVQTGTLRRSITYRIDQSITEVSGVVGTNVPYAKVHEFGLTVTQQVRAHARTQVMGHNQAPSLAEILAMKKKDLKSKTTASGRFKGGTAQVRGFTRQITYPKRAFMAPAFRFSQPFIIASLSGALATALAMRGEAK